MVIPGSLGFWNRRWVRPRGELTRRYHIGDVNERLSARYGTVAISAYCGLLIMGGSVGSAQIVRVAEEDGAKRIRVALDACPPDACDPTLHCRQCDRSLTRRLAGRRP